MSKDWPAILVAGLFGSGQVEFPFLCLIGWETISLHGSCRMQVNRSSGRYSETLAAGFSKQVPVLSIASL